MTVVSACWVLARISDRGEALSRQLQTALDRLAKAEAVRALCALCTQLATEETAAVVISMLRDPLPEARAVAREALQAWQSPWIRIEGNDPPAIVPGYEDETGQPLARRGAPSRLTSPLPRCR